LHEAGCEAELADKVKWSLDNWKKVDQEAKDNTAAIKQLLPKALGNSYRRNQTYSTKNH